MTYELAKKLKDAGFPQELKIGDWFQIEGEPGRRMEIYPVKQPNECIYVRYPTLSELIEACEKEYETIGGSMCRFCLQYWEDNRWMAGYSANIVINVPYYGDTPEEAVSTLWLALHEKK